MDVQETIIADHLGSDTEPLPFPLQQNFCRFESIEKTINTARVLVVDNLLRDENDLSAIARIEFGKNVNSQMKVERHIASLALHNIVTNIQRLVKEPITRVVHISEVAETAKEFQPDAIVLSGTLRDFDYYKPELLAGFSDFIHAGDCRVSNGRCGGRKPASRAMDGGP